MILYFLRIIYLIILKMCLDKGLHANRLKILKFSRTLFFSELLVMVIEAYVEFLIAGYFNTKFFKGSDYFTEKLSERIS